MTAAQGHVGFTLYSAFWQPNVELPSSTRASCSCRACGLVGRDHIWWSVWMSRSPSVSLKSRLIQKPKLWIWLTVISGISALPPSFSYSVLLCLSVSPTTVCRLCVLCKAPAWRVNGAEGCDPPLHPAPASGGMEGKGALFLAICQWGSKKILPSNPSAHRGWLSDFF